MSALADGTLDAIFDEALVLWLDSALAAGMVPLELEPETFARLGAFGWRRVAITPAEFPHLKRDHACIDYSGWPLYASAALPDQTVYEVCAAFAAREAEIPWEDTYTGVAQLGRDTEATPIDVPLHPGAERFYREQSLR
jgi:TRAP-type uncharacterized transport system substrate-binding protein